MKKKIKMLNLNKRTISNLNVPEMSEKIGGQWTVGCSGHICHMSQGNNCGGGGNNTTHCPTAYGKNTCAPVC